MGKGNNIRAAGKIGKNNSLENQQRRRCYFTAVNTGAAGTGKNNSSENQ